MAQYKRQPTEKEKRQLVDAIEKDDTDTVQQIIQHGSVDVDAYINWTTWTTIIGRWHYTALHLAVYEDKLNCVKLLIQLGASLTITDYIWSDKSRKIPLQRAVDKNRPSIVHYFVKECNQDISELHQNYQSKIHNMIQRHDCIIAKEKMASYYAELASLPITSLLANLQGKEVITVEEKERIKANPEESDRMQYFLDHVIVPSLNDSAINKFNGFLEVMEESGNSELLSAAVKLGLVVTEIPLPCPGVNIKEIFYKYYAQLVISLPMKDAIFVSHLIRLLPGNLKAEVEAKPTPADAVAWFLDKGIKPAVESADNEPFIFLLSVMEKFGLKHLCASIKAEILLLVDQNKSTST